MTRNELIASIMLEAAYLLKEDTMDNLLESNILNESIFFSKDDLYKNFDKFENGENNILLITGVSGSGKSTLGRNIAKKYNAEYIELDCMDPHSNLMTQGLDIARKAGQVFYDFLISHKKYYESMNTMSNKDISLMMDSFFEYCLSYCSKNKNKKFVIEGIQIYDYYNYYKKIVSYPIIIKNTSVLKSFIRKVKREEWKFKHVLKNGPGVFKNMIRSDRELSELVSSLNEAQSIINKNFKQKGNLNLKSFNKVHLTENIINKYKKDYPSLRHVRCKDTNKYICDGYAWFDKGRLVCVVGSCEYTDTYEKYIVSLEVMEDYKGYGLSKQLLKFAVNDMGCTKLSVNKNNKLAKKVYDDFGFKIFYEDDNMFYMEIES